MFLLSRAKSTTTLAVLTSIFLIGSALPIFATSSDITIQTPNLNQQFNTGSISVSGTFQSPTNPPSISFSVDNNGYSASVSVSSSTSDSAKGTWSGSASVGNGWHTLKVTISDSNGALSDSSQFYVNDGSVNVKQLKYKQLNIEYTPACVALLKSGDILSCPVLARIIPYDNSTQSVSGKFILDNKGNFHRGPPQLKNAYQFYDKTTVCVDCLIDANSESQMQTIWINPVGFSYTQHDFTGSTVTKYEQTINGSMVPYTATVNEQNAGLTVYHDKYVDDSCMRAEVVYNDQNTIPSTIKYMTGGCKDKSYFNTTQTIIPYHPFQMDSQFSSLKGIAYLKSIFQGHTQLHNEKMPTGGGLGPANCINVKCKYTDPYKKSGW